MGFNYVLVFSPNALSDAPHNLAATIDLAAGHGAAAACCAAGARLPFELGDRGRQPAARRPRAALADVDGDPRRRLGGGAGRARGAARRDRRGARQPASTTMSSCGCWAPAGASCCCCSWPSTACSPAVLALVALALGSAIAWLVMVQLFEFDWLPDWPRVLAVLGAGLAAGAGFRAGRLAAAVAGEAGAGAAGTLGEDLRRCCRILRIRAEAVGSARALKAHEHKHDQSADIGNKVQQKKPAGLVLVMKPPNLHRQ